MTDNDNIRILRTMVKGAYDLQLVRMQTGIRLTANFRAKLGLAPQDATDEDARREAQKVLDQLKASYKRLTDGVARNRTLPAEKGFAGDELISTFPELVLIHNYLGIAKNEDDMFASLEKVLAAIPIYATYLKDQVGVGPAMAGVLVAYLDPHKARHASSFWKYAGLDTGPDGRGRSRRAEHLVERTYKDKNGNDKTRMGITYEPFLKAKCMGVLAGSFLRVGSPWREVYDDYKHRLETDPARIKVTLTRWKQMNAAGDDITALWPPGRIDFAAKRYMVKMFLAELWAAWRTLEGLPVSDPYAVAMQGRRPHRAA